MTVTVRRTFTTLVLALVAALTVPVAAGATVPSVEGAITQEEVDPFPLHDDDEQLVDLIDGEQAETEVGPEELVEIEIPVPDDAAADDLPEAVRAEEHDVREEDGHAVHGEGEDTTEPVGDPEGSTDDGVDEALSRVAVQGPATRIAAGLDHSLYLDGHGQVWAWGNNLDGQLGNGTTVRSLVPVRVDMDGALAGVEVVAVAAGHLHSMALDSEGRVYTWGRNAEGALGIGTTTNRTTPVRVGGLLANQRVVKISAEGTLTTNGTLFSNSAALTENGRVYTWGSGGSGRLGNGTTTTRQTTPVLVGGQIANLRIVDLDVGGRQTVVLSDTGRIFSWGYRVTGSMGNGVSSAGTSSSPVAATMTGALSGVRIVQVRSRSDGGVALSDDGRVFGWGANPYGQIGRGNTTNSTVPVAADMAAFDNIGNAPTQISSGQLFSVALGQHGRVAAWGGGSQGQIGNGSSLNATRATEVSVSGVMGGAHIIQVSAGHSHAVALADDGRLFAWGRGVGGGLGDGGTSSSNIPVQVGGLRVLTQPDDVVVEAGEEAVFTVSSSEPAATVQWQVSVDDGQSWAQVEGATGTTHSTGPTSRDMSGWRFRAVLSSTSDFPVVVVSRAASLTVQERTDPPVVTLHPAERVRSLVGLDVALTADAVSPTPMTVQWQSSTDQGSTWSDVSGATEKTHELVATEDLHGALFRAVFTNPSGTATTNDALLEVVLAAPAAHLVVTPQARHVDAVGGVDV